MTHKFASFMVAGAMLLAIPLGASANPAHDQLKSMTEAKRQALLTKFMAKSNKQCTAVTQTFYQGSDQNDNAIWNAKCADGSTFAIQVNNDAGGSTRIISCAVLKSVSGQKCFTKFKK